MGGLILDFFTKRESVIVIASIFLIGLLLSIKALGSERVAKLEGVSAAFTENPILDDVTVSTPIQKEDSLIMVYISGQVYSPGIYELVLGDRVVDAVNMAGGLSKQADLDKINLAKKVNDEEKIYIPAIGEEIPFSVDVETNSQESGKININVASSADLESLPGIGEVIAGRIIEYRKTNKFNSIEDILEVSGIGDAKFESIKDLISIN